MRRLVLMIFASLVSATPSQAQQDQPMTIALVRMALPGCDPYCPEFISAQGVVQPDSDRKLRRLLDSLNGQRPPVVINSSGGNVDAAMAMGRAIRTLGLDVAVARVVPGAICQTGDSACVAEQKGKPPMRSVSFDQTICSSACTLVLAGGIRRIIMGNARIGVHSMAESETERVIERVYRRSGDQVGEGGREIISERVISQKSRTVDAPPEVANRGVPEHLASMGINRRFTEITLATPHSQIRVLSAKEMMDTGIATHNAEPLKVLGFLPQ
jgi:hypothetical protein